MKFKIGCTTFEASFLSVAVMTAVLMLDKSGKIALCFLSAVIHECGHIASMRCFRIVPDSIRLRLFDIAIDADIKRAFFPQLIITLSGPAMNILLSLLFYYLYKPMFYINLCIGLFNLLPVETFDGGHALSLLLSKKLSYSTVRLILKILTFVFLVPVFLLGVLVLLYSKYNYSLLLISLYLLAILFLK